MLGGAAVSILLVVLCFVIKQINELERECISIRKELENIAPAIKDIDATADRIEKHLYEVAPSRSMIEWERYLERP